MWKGEQQTRKKEVLSSHFVESSRPSLKTVRLEVQVGTIERSLYIIPIDLEILQQIL